MKLLPANKRGSTLITVLMIMAVLSLLGTAILALAVTNYRLRLTEEKAKASFYLAESGLEQAFGIIAAEIAEGVNRGNEAVNQLLEEFIAAERELVQMSIGSDSPYFSPYLNEDGSINEEAVKAKINEWLPDFQQAYRNYINNQSSLPSKLTNPANYKSVEGSPDVQKPELQLAGEVINFSGSSPYEITLVSSYSLDGVRQRVKLTFQLQTPDRILPNLFFENTFVEVTDSPLWDNIISTNKNLYISGGAASLHGDVFVKGTIPPSAGERIHTENFGGVIIGINSMGEQVPASSAEIDGNLFSESNANTRADDSSLSVTKNAYINSLVAQAGTENTSLQIGASLYTKDDVELNGGRARIQIGSNYYGFSDGSQAANHDESSSIVINSPDIQEPDGSYIQIGGSSFIAGTVYINSPNDAGLLYQTGESVAIQGNYRAYGAILPGDEREYGFEEFGPLVLINGYYEHGNFRQLNVNDKSNHIYQAFESENNFLGLDTGYFNRINIGNVLQSIGAYIINESGNMKIRPMLFTAEVFEPKRLELQGSYLAALANEAAKFNIFNNLPNIIKPYSPSTKELIYVTSQDIALLAPGSSTENLPTENIIAINTESFVKGVIITTGNVYIRGSLTYRGFIGAQGSIYIEDSSSKVFRTDKEYLRRASYENPLLMNIFPYNPDSPKVRFNYLSETGLVAFEALSPYTDLIKIRDWEKLE